MRLLPRVAMWSVHGGATWAEEAALDFSDNSNPLGPPSKLIQLVAEAVERGVYLKFPANLAEEVLSQYEEVPVVVFNGATEAISAAASWLRPRRIVTLRHDYRDYARVAEVLGVPHLSADWPPPLEERDLFIFSNPSNPFGSYVPRDVVFELAKKARVLVDESFIDFCRCESSAPDVPVVKSYGKFLAAPGLRIGAAVGGFFPKSHAPPWRINSIVDYAVYHLGVEGLRGHKLNTLLYITQEVPRVLEALSKCVKYSPTQVHFFVIYGHPPRGVRVRPLWDRGVEGYRVSIKDRDSNDWLIKTICA
ncbi:MAG: aminotransferase class I/II-fold pyridoxal phosphate-dependent enzyme [Pyrobaculum sp.]